MDTPAAAEIVPETIEQPAAQADEGGSLADHEALYRPDAPRAENTKLDEVDGEKDDAGQTAEDRARDKAGRFAKHRAASQKATPDDVGEINRLTAELRTKEAEWKQRNPEATEDSPRIKALKRQIKALDVDLQPAPAAPEPSKPAAAPQSAPSATFDEAEPQYDDFLKEADPLQAYYKAIARWTARKERFDERAAEQVAAKQRADEEMLSAAAKRVDTFKASKPDFQTVTAEFSQRHLPPVFLQAMVGHDKLGEFMYYLGQHADAADDLVLLTEGKTPTPESVASVRRRLERLVAGTQVVPTGSTAPQTRPYNPPKPPNPVRTGPNRSGTELPDEDASLAEHERAFSRRK